MRISSEMTRLLGVFLVLGLSVAVPSTAAAQLPEPRPERPYRGVFGGGSGDTGQGLTANLSLSGGFNDSKFRDWIPGPTGAAPQGRDRVRGSFSQVNGGLSYGLDRSRFTVGGSLAGSARYHSRFSDRIIGSYSGSLGASLRLTESTSISGSGSASYSPYYHLGLFPGAVDPALGETFAPDFDQTAARGTVRTEAGSVGISQGLGRRVFLSAHASTHRTRFGDFGADQRSRTVGARLSYALAQGLSMRIGYSRGTTESPSLAGSASQAFVIENIDAGIDFSRQLSISRRTTLSFSTGATGFSDGRNTHYTFVGGATLAHEIGRSWYAALAYNRNVAFFDAALQPVINDGLRVSVSGLVGRRLQFHSNLGATTGELAFGVGGNRFQGYHASTGLGIGLSRYLALNLDYSYYRHVFDADTSLVYGFFSRVDRQTIRASVGVWVPLFHRARRADASR